MPHKAENSSVAGAGEVGAGAGHRERSCWCKEMAPCLMYVVLTESTRQFQNPKLANCHRCRCLDPGVCTKLRAWAAPAAQQSGPCQLRSSWEASLLGAACQFQFKQFCCVVRGRH